MQSLLAVDDVPLPSKISARAIADQLVCPVCMDEAHRDLRTLPCGHSVCYGCLIAMMRRAPWTCPSCRTPIDRVPAPNVMLRAVLEACGLRVAAAPPAAVSGLGRRAAARTPRGPYAPPRTATDCPRGRPPKRAVPVEERVGRARNPSNGIVVPTPSAIFAMENAASGQSAAANGQRVVAVTPNVPHVMPFRDALTLCDNEPVLAGAYFLGRARNPSNGIVVPTPSAVYA